MTGFGFSLKKNGGGSGNVPAFPRTFRKQGKPDVKIMDTIQDPRTSVRETQIPFSWATHRVITPGGKLIDLEAYIHLIEEEGYEEVL